MKYILSALLLLASAGCFSQAKEYLYYFDRDLNMADESHAVFYGTGAYENGLLKLMLYNNQDKHLIMIEHFTDSTLQLNDGLFSSYYTNSVKESEGNYAKGKQDGWWERWDSSGNVIDSSLYTNGDIATGISYHYFSDKKIQSTALYDMANHKFRITDYDQSGNMIKINSVENEDEDRVFTKVEIEAQFPGGPAAWTKYITMIIQQHIDEFTKSDYGTCQVGFIVRRDGKVTDVKLYTKTMKGTKLANIILTAIENGPDWIPAQQNGRKVTAYRIQPVTLNETK
jgi:hypothetical protein